jgi:3-methyladenine DNA glycosylase/8-oxoguanine DNA glycosylase
MEEAFFWMFKGTEMANTAATTDVVELDAFRSPARVLAGCFLRSRDKWKRKYEGLKSELKRYQVRVHDVTQSRERWREKAEARERELAALQAELQELQRQVGSPPSEQEKKGSARTC